MGGVGRKDDTQQDASCLATQGELLGGKNLSVEIIERSLGSIKQRWRKASIKQRGVLLLATTHLMNACGEPTGSIRTLKGELDVGLEISGAVARIVVPTFEAKTKKRLSLAKQV